MSQSRVLCFSSVLILASCALGADTRSSVRTYVDAMSYSGPADDSEWLKWRLDKYCALPAFGRKDEAVSPGPAGLELRQVHVIIRHGDRSAIHEGTLPGLERATFTCAAPSVEVLEEAASLLLPFRSSAECILDGGAACERLPVRGPLLEPGPDRALDAWGQARATGEVCGPQGGELSSKGWEQVKAVGNSLGEAYSSFLSSPSPSRTPLQLVSTDTGRTVLTALGVLTGLLQPFGAQAGQGAVGLPQGDKEQAALINGKLSNLLDGRSHPALGLLPHLRLPLPLHIVPRASDPLLHSKRMLACPRARALQEEHGATMFAHARINGTLGVRLSALSGLPVDSLPTAEEVADVTFAKLCHGQGLPCFNKDKGEGRGDSSTGLTRRRRSEVSPTNTELECLTESEAVAVLKQGDLFYGTRFNSSSTRLLAYPLLRQLAMSMRRAASQAEADPACPRLTLRAAHDTVLSPLLLTLGIRDGPLAWPGYASRVAFELWSPAAHAPTRAAAQVGGPTEGTGGREGEGEHHHHDTAFAHDGDGSASVSYVRLLFNGVDWTAHLPCSRVVLTTGMDGKAFEPDTSYAPATAPPVPGQRCMGARVFPGFACLCSLMEFHHTVEDLIMPAGSWEEACATPWRGAGARDEL